MAETFSELEQHRILHRAGQSIDDVYLLESGIVSLLYVASDGRSIETSTIGSGGVVGADVLLRSERSSTKAIVAIAGRARCMPTEEFLHLAESSAEVKDRALRSLDSQLSQAQQSALCHALHSVEARFCRWLLQASDALDAGILNLTQESFVHLLGVQRTTISMIAHGLQVAGAIRTSRGKVRLLDKTLLANRACDCYTRLDSRPEFTELKPFQRQPGAAFAANV